MRVNGSDFTNTFRILSEISKDINFTDKDNQILEELVSYSAPKIALRKRTKAKYPPATLNKLKIILENEPDTLKLFGLNPDSIRAEIEAMEQPP